MNHRAVQDSDPSAHRWGWRAARPLARALTRLWGRDVMLYTGGVSFFSLLAIFPALAILVTLYSLLSSPLQAEREGELLALVIPEGARSIVQQELVRLAHAPHVAMTA